MEQMKKRAEAAEQKVEVYNAFLFFAVKKNGGKLDISRKELETKSGQIAEIAVNVDLNTDTITLTAQE